MANDFRPFERAYGREVPRALKVLYDDSALLAKVPQRIVLSGRPFVAEVQYYRGIAELVAEDVASQRFAFAVNSDGHDMLVDLTEQDLPVLQREFGKVDRLDFTHTEFLAAATHPAID